MARQLTQSVSYIHTYNFVHKSIRPDTILVLKNDDTDLAASFLLGFEKFRTADGQTLKSGDSAWEKDLYRHPQRQGFNPEDAYVMQHDIYSLGVCLLEVGLWQSFMTLDRNGIMRPTGLLASDIHNGSDLIDVGNAFRLKECLVELARTKLPGRMGDTFTEVVMNCLTCLDEDNEDFGNPEEFEDEDGVQIGVRYIEKVSAQS